MIKREDISISVIKRLPRYYRFLGELIKKDIDRISSRELSSKMGLTASLIRQDLNCFGGFGQQGYGYNVKLLHEEIGQILGLDSSFRAIIIGAGNLGRVIATHMDFEKRGFQLIGIFDKKESMAGQLVRGMPVRHIDGLDEFCRENLPQVAILCIPAEAAFEITDALVRLGIQGFWNFTHSDLALRYPGLPVENVHLGDSLMTFCYRMKEKLEHPVSDR
ncbi:MAG: redox-sensing transcriptional repressor Rex [Clostridiales bacterium 43-6]|nr:MAG: redox-sensing transcriptional repressor Rex [Clostridiales bacterium 43-6]